MEKYSEWVLAVCGAVILVLTYFPEAIQSLNPERKQLAEFHFISNLSFPITLTDFFASSRATWVSHLKQKVTHLSNNHKNLK